MSEKIFFEPTWELPNPFYNEDGSIMSTIRQSSPI